MNPQDYDPDFEEYFSDFDWDAAEQGQEEAEYFFKLIEQKDLATLAKELSPARRKRTSTESESPRNQISSTLKTSMLKV